MGYKFEYQMKIESIGFDPANIETGTAQLTNSSGIEVSTPLHFLSSVGKLNKNTSIEFTLTDSDESMKDDENVFRVTSFGTDKHGKVTYELVHIYLDEDNESEQYYIAVTSTYDLSDVSLYDYVKVNFTRTDLTRLVNTI